MDYEAFIELVRSRRSVRKFTDKKIDRNKIDSLIEAACWAPSSHNRQGWKFIVFDDDYQIKKLAETIRQYIKDTLSDSNRQLSSRTDEIIYYSGAFEDAPVVVFVMHKKSPAVATAMLKTATGQLASGEAISAAMACENLLLTAHAMGLGGCVMTAPLLAGKVWDSLEDLPLGYEPTCLIALGYPAEAPCAPARKKLEHVIEYR